jgi:hypothetical protein
MSVDTSRREILTRLTAGSVATLITAKEVDQVTAEGEPTAKFDYSPSTPNPDETALLKREDSVVRGTNAGIDVFDGGSESEFTELAVPGPGR